MLTSIIESTPKSLFFMEEIKIPNFKFKVPGSKFQVACRLNATHPLTLTFKLHSYRNATWNLEPGTWNFEPTKAESTFRSELIIQSYIQQ